MSYAPPISTETLATGRTNAGALANNADGAQWRHIICVHKPGMNLLTYGARTMAKNKSSERELIDTGRDKRFVRRDAEGKFKESDDQGQSLPQDRKTKAKTRSKSGQGDKGDRNTSR